MSEASVAIAVAGLALIGAVVTGLMTRRSSREANATTAWAALLAATQNEQTRLASRVDTLEQKVDLERDARRELADKLDHEREERRTLGNILRSALTHIFRLGDQVREFGGRPESMPTELDAWMRRDGLVVDRVETTISRTTVTDSRDPAEALESHTFEVTRNQDPATD